MNATLAALKSLRVAAGLTLDSAGAQVGVHGASVSRWESGNRAPQDAGVVRRLIFYYLEEAERRAHEAKELVKNLL